MKVSQKKIRFMVAVMIAISSLLVNNQRIFAQENPQTPPKQQPVQSNWESWKSDMKGQFQKVRMDADDLRKQINEKKSKDQEVQDALSKFDAASNAFNTRWADADKIPEVQRDAYKEEMKDLLDKVNASFNHLKEVWSAKSNEIPGKQ